MAQASGLSVSSVQRIWRAFGLQPHHAETFKFSTDPLFVEKCAMSSAFTSRRRSARSCSASMRKSQIPALDRNTGLDGGRGAAIQQSHGSLLLEELDIPSRQVGPTHPEAVGHPRDKVRLYSPHKPLFGLLIGSNVAQPRG